MNVVLEQKDTLDIEISKYKHFYQYTEFLILHSDRGLLWKLHCCLASVHLLNLVVWSIIQELRFYPVLEVQCTRPITLPRLNFNYFPLVSVDTFSSQITKLHQGQGSHTQPGSSCLVHGTKSDEVTYDINLFYVFLVIYPPKLIRHKSVGTKKLVAAFFRCWINQGFISSLVYSMQTLPLKSHSVYL